MTLTVDSTIFQSVHAASNPSGLTTSQLLEVVEFVNLSPTLRGWLETFQGDGGEIRFGEPGTGTRFDNSASPARILLDPNDFGSAVFDVTYWVYALAHEGWHAVSPEPEPNTLSSYQWAGAQGVREEAFADGAVYLVGREINASAGARIDLVQWFADPARVRAIADRIDLLPADASSGQILSAAASALLPFKAADAPSVASYETYFEFYGDGWAQEHPGEAPLPPLAGTLRMVDADGDAHINWITYQVGTDPATATRLSYALDLATGEFVASLGNTFTHVALTESGPLSTSTWTVNPTGALSVFVERTVNERSVKLTFEVHGETNRLAVTQIEIGGVILPNQEAAASALNYAGLTPQDFAGRAFGDGLSRIDGVADIIRHFDPAAPGVPSAADILGGLYSGDAGAVAALNAALMPDPVTGLTLTGRRYWSMFRKSQDTSRWKFLLCKVM